jgi:hypothetical protein
MTLFRRRLRSLALLSVALLALAGVGMWGWPARRHLPERPEEARQAQLERRSQAIRQRLEAKAEVVRRLLASRLTLLEAAALFGHLNEQPAAWPCLDNLRWPGASREEKLCRQVVDWAISLAPEEGGRAVEAAGRLEAELAALLARGEPIRLPGDEPGR